MSPIVFVVVTARARLPHVVFAISPAVGDFHQLGDGFGLQAAQLFDVEFSSDAVIESIDCPIDRNFFGCVQEFGEASDV